jgi:hypothetical protein
MKDKENGCIRLSDSHLGRASNIFVGQMTFDSPNALAEMRREWPLRFDLLLAIDWLQHGLSNRDGRLGVRNESTFGHISSPALAVSLRRHCEKSQQKKKSPTHGFLHQIIALEPLEDSRRAHASAHAHGHHAVAELPALHFAQ